MATTEKKEQTPAKQLVPKVPTLHQKFIELRKAISAIVQSATSEQDRNLSDISDIYRLIVPAMNEQGVNFDIIEEKASKHDVNGDGKYVTTFTKKTSKGEFIVWVYEADLVIRWTNAENTKDTVDVTLHAIGTNDSGPDKAKGSAWTYCLKYYLFEKFGIDQGTNDPDKQDHSTAPPQKLPQGNTESQNSVGNNTPPNTMRPLSEAQLNRLYNKAGAARMSQQQVIDFIFRQYGQHDPHNLTRQQYDEVCGYMDNMTRQGGNRNAQ